MIVEGEDDEVLRLYRGFTTIKYGHLVSTVEKRVGTLTTKIVVVLITDVFFEGKTQTTVQISKRFSPSRPNLKIPT